MTGSRPGPVVYEFGPYRLEPGHRALTHRNGQRVELAGKAFDALVYLVEHAGAAVTRDEIMNALWPRTIVEDNNLHQAIAAIRRALGAEQFIATLQGRGYQFVADVRVVGPTVESVAPASHPERAEPAGVPPRRKAGSAGPLLKYGSAVAAVAVVVALVVYAGGFGFSDGERSRLPGVVRATPLTHFSGDEISPSLSPEGSRVAFSWNDGGNRDIYVTLVDGSSQPQRLTYAVEPDNDPAWSPDGRRIAFLRRMTPTRRDIFVVPAVGGTEEFLRSIYLRSIEGVNLAAPKLDWTADGQHLLFASAADEKSDGTHIYALSLGTGELTQLTSGSPPYDNSPALSPDGAWLAYRKDPTNPSAFGTFFVQRLGADFAAIGEPIAVPIEARTPLVPHSPSWSMDARYLTLVAAANLIEWQPGAAEVRVVYSGAALSGFLPGELSRLSLLRKPTTVAVVGAIGDGSRPDIWALPLDPRTHAPTGPAIERFFSTQRDGQPRYSPDGTRVAFNSNRSSAFPQIWVAASDGSEERPVPGLEPEAAFYPNWSPNGRDLVFYTDHEGRNQIYIIAADGGPPRPVAVGGGPSFSGDGEHLYVTEPGGEPYKLVRVRIADGQRQELFSGHIALESQDGRTLFYWRDKEPHVYRRSLDGDAADNPEERLVATTVGGIAPVEDGFFFVGLTPNGGPDSIEFYEYATRTTRRIAATPGIMPDPGTLTVSHDGTELLFAARVSTSGADLVRIEFEPVGR